LYQLVENVTAAAAVAPTLALVGLVPDQSAPASVLYSHNNGVIYNPAAATALPTPTTLGNANFFTNYFIHGTVPTITPATWTISLNGGTAGATAAPTAYTKCSQVVDQVASTQWDLDCVSLSGYLNGVQLSGLASGILYITTATGIPSTATAAQILTACTGCAPLASPTFTGVVTAPVYELNGTTATFEAFAQGTTSAAVAPCNGANTRCKQAPTAVTAMLENIAGTVPVIPSYEQTNGCPASVCTDSWHAVPVVLTVTSDFTDSTSTTLVLVTGLSTTMPVSQAAVVKYDCLLYFDQATAAVVDEIGVGITGTAPTYSNHHAVVWAAASHAWSATGVLSDLASTTPTSVVSFTPSAITTIWSAELSGTIEQPSNATPGVFGVYVYTTTGSDNFIVKRDSACSVIYQ
jgi:hypothetical protein